MTALLLKVMEIWSSQKLGKSVQKSGSLENGSKLGLRRQTGLEKPAKGERARGRGLLRNFNFCPVLSNG